MISDTFCVFLIDKTSGYQRLLIVFIGVAIENKLGHGHVRMNGMSKHPLRLIVAYGVRI